MTFNSILASSNTTKSRFLRLYLICIIWILVFTPMQIFIIANNARLVASPFKWRETHDYAAYNEILLVPSHGSVLIDRWFWIAAGVMVFAFFGFGREAINMYRTGLLAIGLGRLFPSLRPEARRLNVSTTSSFSSKAKLFFSRKSSMSPTTRTSGSSATRTFNSDDKPISPKNATFLEAIREASPETDVEKGVAHGHTQQPSIVSRLSSLFRGSRGQQRLSSWVSMANFGNQDGTVKSAVSTGQRPGSLAQHLRDTSAEVLVRTEVRQASEHEK